MHAPNDNHAPSTRCQRCFTLRAHQMFSFYTTPEEFENGDFFLKTHQMFSFRTTHRRNLRTVPTIVIAMGGAYNTGIFLRGLKLCGESRT